MGYYIISDQVRLLSKSDLRGGLEIGLLYPIIN